MSGVGQGRQEAGAVGTGAWIGGQEWLWHSAPKSSTGTP